MNKTNVSRPGSQKSGVAFPWGISVGLVLPGDAVRVPGMCLYLVSLACDDP